MNINRIRTDIGVARNCISPVGNPTNDEYYYDIAAYHTQQALEKCIKYYLSDIYTVDETSKEYKTHNIATLILMLTQLDKGAFLSQFPEVIKIADKATKWEASCRYGESLFSTKQDIEYVLNITEQIFQTIQEIELFAENKTVQEQEDNNFER